MANESFVPLSSQAQKKLNDPKCNFSLYSPRMVLWKLMGKELKVDDGAVSVLCAKSKNLLSSASDFLEKKHELQEAYIDSLKQQGITTFSIQAKTSSPFITGLGSGHPTETGMILDRNTGVPYLPASSIKGVMRLACAVKLAETKYADDNVPENDATLVKYFGAMTQDEKNQSRGQLMFLDAYPVRCNGLKLDIMNPHFGAYYSGKNKQPVETESPVPIKFMTVKEGTTFVFRAAFIPLDGGKCDIEEVNAMFTTAFERIGFGGKTAIGYGRFKEL